jgi:multidrug efflux pump subunit AcrB
MSILARSITEKTIANVQRDGERIFVEFSMQELASPRPRPDRADQCPAGAERRASRRHDPDRQRQDVRAINFAVGGRMLRLGDIAQVRRGFADPPQPIFRVNGEPGIGVEARSQDSGW